MLIWCLFCLQFFRIHREGSPSYISKPLMIGGYRGIPMILAFIFIHKRCQRLRPEPLTYKKSSPGGLLCLPHEVLLNCVIKQMSRQIIPR